jgi:predicted AlkP superfamily phosphohydrolase/phosphomutase
MPVPNYKVLVLGLDGATFDLMLPWIREGHLPSLGRLHDQGAHSVLRSTIPPVTPCAWSSFLTGKSPGKHGLFDFVELTPDGRGFSFTNAASRRGESLWGCLSRHGRRVGVLNVPMTYPPERVNGYLMSGLDTPNERSPFTYPEELRQELAARSIDYRIDIQHLGNMRTDRHRDQRLQELCAVEAERTRALRYLTTRYPADFRMLVYTATDQVQHHFWHYMDPRHDKYDARGAERYGNAIRDIYVHVDTLIDSILKEEGEDTVVLIMSDHGFGPTTSVRLRLNQALEAAGLLAFRREGSSGRALRSLAGWADRLLRSTLSNNAKRRLAGFFPRLRVWFDNLDEAQFDWDRTKAYTNEWYPSCPSVWINRRYHQAAANGHAADSLEDVLREAEALLKKLTDPATGRPLVSQVYRTRDLYTGPYVSKAPDLIPSWWEDGFLLDHSQPGEGLARAVERSTDPVTGGVEWTGSHRLEGVFMIAGGPARSGHVFSGAQIIDVAPTVLYLMGLPIPGDMDGRPLLEALDPAFVADHPPTYEQSQSSDQAPPTAGDQVFTEAEEALISERLQSMGYIE